MNCIKMELYELRRVSLTCSHGLANILEFLKMNLDDIILLIALFLETNIQYI
jgi:hypothetical protein